MYPLSSEYKRRGEKQKKKGYPMSNEYKRGKREKKNGIFLLLLCGKTKDLSTTPTNEINQNILFFGFS